MRINTAVRTATVAILIVSMAGCGPPEKARRAAESAASAAQVNASTQAGEVISTRREAQRHLDSARAGFLANDATIAAGELQDAAVFTRAQADSATGGAKKALSNSAAELETLATQVTKNRVKSVKTLDFAFARTQLAETRFHHERAGAAFRETKPAAAGAELMMAADHFERAFADAGQTARDSAKTAIADARSVASKLISGASVSPADVELTLASFDHEVRSFAAIAAKLKG